MGIPVLLLALPFLPTVEAVTDPLMRAVQTAFLMAAVPEELMKWTVVFFYCAKKSEFDEPMDGFVYGATASLGFAALENILYVADGGLGVALLRAFTAVPAHAVFGAVMGYFIARAIFMDPTRRRWNLLLSLAVPTFLHGIYNSSLMYLDFLDEAQLEALGGLVLLPFIVFLVTLVGSWIWVRRLLARAVEEQAMMEAES